MLNHQGLEHVVEAAADESSSRLHTFRLVIAILWSVMMMVMCWLPRAIVREVKDGSSWFDIPHFDKVIHGAIFVGFALLWMRAGSGRLRWLWVLAAGVLFAGLTEVVQGLPVVGRDASFADGLADVVGVLLGILLTPWIEPMARFMESLIAKRVGLGPRRGEPLVRESG